MRKTVAEQSAETMRLSDTHHLSVTRFDPAVTRSAREKNLSRPMLQRVSSRARTAIEHTPCLPLGRLEVVAERAHNYATAAKAPNTVRAYAADWRDFTTSSPGLDPRP